MPYRWTPAHTTPLPRAMPDADAPDTAAPVMRLDLWPHRSLKGKGFSATIWIMFFGGLIPVVPFIGTIAFWILLIFMMTVLAALWTALRRSDRDRLREEMQIWPDRIRLTHWPAKGEPKTWEANPYWVRLTLHPDNGKVEQYLTLKGGGPEPAREVELGAFLSSEEREKLRDDLAFVLGQLKG
ncbi:DUF2244 domain-containing protein [Celeribacter halophilus]|uniref:DUF2244 domain-containing protein n=1 Tax=Celeribacter halophilus TaxID=576117 RepID=UPI003A92DBD2